VDQWGLLAVKKIYFIMAIERDNVMSCGEKRKCKEIELGVEQEKVERRTFLGAVVPI
jgi:hypothetical protein